MTPATTDHRGHWNPFTWHSRMVTVYFLLASVAAHVGWRLAIAPVVAGLVEAFAMFYADRVYPTCAQCFGREKGGGA